MPKIPRVTTHNGIVCASFSNPDEEIVTVAAIFSLYPGVYAQKINLNQVEVVPNKHANLEKVETLVVTAAYLATQMHDLESFWAIDIDSHIQNISKNVDTNITHPIDVDVAKEMIRARIALLAMNTLNSDYHDKIVVRSFFILSQRLHEAEEYDKYFCSHVVMEADKKAAISAEIDHLLEKLYQDTTRLAPLQPALLSLKSDWVRRFKAFRTEMEQTPACTPEQYTTWKALVSELNRIAIQYGEIVKDIDFTAGEAHLERIRALCNAPVI